LNGAPPPPCLPRTITNPASGPRRRVCGGNGGASRNRSAISNAVARASTPIQRRRAATFSMGEAVS
jgi:hypothetical protein